MFGNRHQSLLLRLVLFITIIFFPQLISSLPSNDNSVIGEWTGSVSAFSEALLSAKVLLLSVCVVVCAAVLLIGCAGLCPRKSQYKLENERYFGDISTNPSLDFGMIPPIESSQECRSTAGGRIIFEPLPDITAKIRSLGEGANQADRFGEEEGTGEDGWRHRGNLDCLRPRVFKMERERFDSLGNIDVGDRLRWGAAVIDVDADAFLLNQLKELQYLREIGVGWFGNVIEGEGQGILPGHKKTKVIVLSLNALEDLHSHVMFLQEANPYRDIDNTNVLKLLSQCVDMQPYLTILEYCPAGDLKTYLRNQRGSVEMFDKQGLLVKFACDMAAGLQAMHQHHYVHRDFSLRNCLVSSDLTIKVGDYGLAEQMFKEDYYFDENGVGVPIRWLAPEVLEVEGGSSPSLKVSFITRDSNLWSFGVALWELVTFCAQPYSDFSNEHVLRLVILERTIRLSKPDVPLQNIDRMYQLMQLCWLEPTQRPSLRELRIMLLHLHSESSMLSGSQSSDIKASDQTSAFDEKWNQLMPRPGGVTNTPANDLIGYDPLGGMTHVVNPNHRLSSGDSFSNGSLDNRVNSPDLAHHFLGGKARGGGGGRGGVGEGLQSTSFESDLSSESMLAHAGSRAISLRGSHAGSRTGTPDYMQTRSMGPVINTVNDLPVPTNEFSFAAEVHAASSVVGSSIDDDASLYWVSSTSSGVGGGAGGGQAHSVADFTEDGFEDDCDLGLGSVGGGGTLVPGSAFKTRCAVEADVHVSCGVAETDNVGRECQEEDSHTVVDSDHNNTLKYSSNTIKTITNMELADEPVTPIVENMHHLSKSGRDITSEAFISAPAETRNDIKEEDPMSDLTPTYDMPNADLTVLRTDHHLCAQDSMYDRQELSEDINDEQIDVTHSIDRREDLASPEEESNGSDDLKMGFDDDLKMDAEDPWNRVEDTGDINGHGDSMSKEFSHFSAVNRDSYQIDSVTNEAFGEDVDKGSGHEKIVNTADSEQVNEMSFAKESSGDYNSFNDKRMTRTNEGTTVSDVLNRDITENPWSMFDDKKITGNGSEQDTMNDITKANSSLLNTNDLIENVDNDDIEE